MTRIWKIKSEAEVRTRTSAKEMTRQLHNSKLKIPISLSKNIQSHIGSEKASCLLKSTFKTLRYAKIKKKTLNRKTWSKML